MKENMEDGLMIIKCSNKKFAKLLAALLTYIKIYRICNLIVEGKHKYFVSYHFVREDGSSGFYNTTINKCYKIMDQEGIDDLQNIIKCGTIFRRLTILQFRKLV